MMLRTRAFVVAASIAVVLAACTPARSPAVVGESLCIALDRRDYDRASFVAGELMADTQPYSNVEALRTFMSWVAAQPCVKDVTRERWEEITQAPVREVDFIVELEGRRSVCAGWFRMQPPWAVVFDGCRRL